MKYLNKNFKNSKLNIKLRELYKKKQEINNSKLNSDLKKNKMKEIDKEINKAWREMSIIDLMEGDE